MATAVKSKPGQKKKAEPKADPKGTPNTAPPRQPEPEQSGPITEAWGLIQSPRGGDLWHAVKFEIQDGHAREAERLTATLKILAIEHIRDNIARLKL